MIAPSSSPLPRADEKVSDSTTFQQPTSVDAPLT